MGRTDDSDYSQLQNNFLDGIINLESSPIINIPAPVAMPQDESHVTIEDMSDPNNPQPGAQPQGANAPNASMSNKTAQKLTEALNFMLQEMVALRMGNAQAGNDNNGGIEAEDNTDNDEAVPPNPNGYYPDLDKICRHLYLNLTDMMTPNNTKAWLRSLENLILIMRCLWVLQKPPVRPANVSAGETQQIRLAIMANFQRRIPSDIKVVLSVDVDDPVISPSKNVFDSNC